MANNMSYLTNAKHILNTQIKLFCVNRDAKRTHKIQTKPTLEKKKKKKKEIKGSFNSFKR